MLDSIIYILNIFYIFIHLLYLLFNIPLTRDASATYGDNLGAKIPNYIQQILGTKIVHFSGTFVEKVSNKSKKYIQTMFPYKVIYNESESDIQNNNLLYKIDQTCQNTFESLKIQNVNNSKCLFYYLYSFHNSNFEFFVNLIILYIYIFCHLMIRRQA